MIAKSAKQVKMNLFLVVILMTFLILPSQSGGQPRCTTSWRPEHPKTSCDDLFYSGLAQSLEQSLHATSKKNNGPYNLCDQEVSNETLRQSYQNLLQFLSAGHSAQDISEYIDNNFTFCTPKTVLVTGYYEPIVPASLRQSEEFPVPLYSAPAKPEDAPHKSFMATRADIENNLLLQGHELVYVKNLFTAFTIHVQGSALLTFADGTMRQVHYQTDNRRQYSSIGRILIDTGKVKKEEMSMQAIKAYTENHPQETRALLQHNERFIYFSMGDPIIDPKFPHGSLGVPLTPERSVALDPARYPPGILLYLQATLPVPALHQTTTFHRRQFGRFTVHQDSGNAIRGEQRLDLFMGRGEDAETLASEMQEDGCLRILLPK